MVGTPVNLEQVLSIWWSMVWRVVVVNVPVSLVLGFIGGFIVGAAGYPGLGAPVGAILAWLGSIPVSIWALKAALLKEHGGYSVELVMASRSER